MIESVVVEAAARLVSGVVRRLTGGRIEAPALEQTAWQRARVDGSRLAARVPIRFGLVTTVTTTAAGLIAADLAQKLSVLAQLGIGVGGAVVGFLAPLGASLIALWATAPTRQRDEARRDLIALTQPGDPAAAAIAAAHGTPVLGQHLALLKNMLERVQLGVANLRWSEVGDDQNGVAFRAHYPSLASAVETWDQAVARGDAADAALLAMVPDEIADRRLTAPRYDPALTPCLQEALTYLSRSRELGVPVTLRFRRAQDVPQPTDAFPLVSVYLNPGYTEYKIAEVEITTDIREDQPLLADKLVEERRAEITEALNAIVQSDAAKDVMAAHEALEALQTPLGDDLRLHHVSAEPRFAEGCPYCLTSIGVEV